MTIQEKLVRRKLSIIELAEFLKNVSQACRINGVSRQHFYDIRKNGEKCGKKWGQGLFSDYRVEIDFSELIESYIRKMAL